MRFGHSGSHREWVNDVQELARMDPSIWCKHGPVPGGPGVLVFYQSECVPFKRYLLENQYFSSWYILLSP